MSDHGRDVRILDLEPVPGRAGPVRRRKPLRNDAFEAPSLALAERQRPQVFAVKLQLVEGLQDGIAHPTAPVERIEHGYAIGAGDNRLPVQRETISRAAWPWPLRWLDSGRSSHSRGG
jgi:hypothetical protein